MDRRYLFRSFYCCLAPQGKSKTRIFQIIYFSDSQKQSFQSTKKIAADTRQEEEFVRRHLDYIETVREDEEDHRSKMRLLKKEINNLPPRRKEILERKYFQDQKNAQIAKEMDISIHTVKVQLYKARLHLRSMIRKDDSKNR